MLEMSVSLEVRPDVSVPTFLRDGATAERALAWALRVAWDQNGALRSRRCCRFQGQYVFLYASFFSFS